MILKHYIDLALMILRISPIKIRKKIELIPFIFTNKDINISNKFVIVTASDTSHFCSLVQFLRSIVIHEPKAIVVVYDLGLLEGEKKFISINYEEVEIRTFNFLKYPDYFNVKINAGEYAWKPVIVDEVLDEFRCCVCWMDAGNILTGPLVWMRKIINSIGLYSPQSSGKISDWTHQKTLDYLRVPNTLLHNRNLNGACIAVSFRFEKVVELIHEWKRCALVRECIAPEGSSRKNHRQDQAVLTVLAHQRGLAGDLPTGYYGFKIHQDVGHLPEGFHR